jgi:hypothetical protein
MPCPAVFTEALEAAVRDPSTLALRTMRRGGAPLPPPPTVPGGHRAGTPAARCATAHHQLAVVRSSRQYGRAPGCKCNHVVHECPSGTAHLQVPAGRSDSATSGTSQRRASCLPLPAIVSGCSMASIAAMHACLRIINLRFGYAGRAAGCLIACMCACGFVGCTRIRRVAQLPGEAAADCSSFSTQSVSFTY